MDAIEHDDWACDGSYACAAVEHIEGCFTGEGEPDADKGRYIAQLRDDLRGAVAENETLRRGIGIATDMLEDGTPNDSIVRMILLDALAASRGASDEQQPTSAQVEQVRKTHQAKRAVRGPEPLMCDDCHEPIAWCVCVASRDSQGTEGDPS